MKHLLIFSSFVALTWIIVLYFLPRMLLTVYKRAILVKGFGGGPIPINTLYTQPKEQFSDPLNALGSSLATTGVNRDTLYTIGWLDLRKGPQILHVPDMDGRYYSVQFTDPTQNTSFHYVGTRTTGTKNGEYLICGPGWKGSATKGMPQIACPKNSILVVGRVFVDDDSDLQVAYELSKQIQISPFLQ